MINGWIVLEIMVCGFGIGLMISSCGQNGLRWALVGYAIIMIAGGAVHVTPGADMKICFACDR